VIGTGYRDPWDPYDEGEPYVRPSREEILPPTDAEVRRTLAGPSRAVEKMIERIIEDGEAKLW
jgi:hypothetical protein